ncbi:MAG: OmpA family protein [Bradymonadales bacterium]|nr:OmpA family protein [Bradymonadales bacterium]
MEPSSSRRVVQGVRLLGILVLSFAILQSQGAQAQSGFDAQQFNPLPSQTVNYFGVASARVLGHGLFNAGAMINYASGPVVLRGPDGEQLVGVVDSQLVADVMGAVGLFDLFELGVSVPMILMQEGESTHLVYSAPDAGFGLGDIRAVPRFLIYSTESLNKPGGISLGILSAVYIPVGDQDQFQGEGGVRVEPRLAFDYAYRDLLRMSLNVGYMVRPENEFADLAIDDTLTYGLGISYHLPLQMYLMGELSGETSILASDIDWAESPLEMLLGIKYMPIDGLLLEAGGGLGLGEGFGNPSWRGFFGVGYGPYIDPDKDDDTYLDWEDQCPYEAEDFDGFQDEDGCLDADNDGDGVLDIDDSCPDEPEDLDGWDDDDGCPDADNDGDGICDPWVAELGQSEIYASLCEGVDQCPDVAEDKDGWQDFDGCPDADNDGDGICDPWVSEMGLLEQYADTCQGVDICPDNAETVNNFEDDDGCPDAQVELIRCEEIAIYWPINFELDSDTILEESYPVLDQLVALLQFQRDIQLVEIAVHVDTIYSADVDYNLSIMRAEEVRHQLMERGMGWTRLVAEGYGDTQRIGDSDTPEGRAQNTRVEFRILQQDGCQ